ncbi:oligosaccharide flippase family protein [Seonamhaeicola algicola]|uniref:Oligosaccharide flippase family protein n=1 Tax=Seonamhaeicola algicola TaxID=1719036 RepID=A0A5C7ATL7_9FLAO|nr:oligosaccharide flippase family protein [Seonamhaeicola algicola]TXE11657.1 oligosaccharide flippase family protein [Seonamhaeicola algicola]
MSQIKKGVVLNYTTIILTNVVGLLLTPFILKSLGQAEYGVYTAIGALVGTISLLDLGLNNTIIRFVAKYKAEKNRQKEENFLATVMLIYLVISVVILILGFLFYNHLETYFSEMDNNEIKVAKTIFILLIINLAVGIPGGSFKAICFGYESFVFPKTLDIIRYVLRCLVVVLVLLSGGKAIALVIIDTIFNFLIILLTFYYIHFKLNVRFKLIELNKNYIKVIFNYSIWIFVYGMVSQFQWKAGHIVLGKISPPEVLAVYAIGVMLGSYYGAFSSAITGVLLPRATQMTINKASSEELTSMMIKVGRVSLIVLLFILGGFTLYGKQFIYLWVGENYYQSWVIALLIMFVYTIPLVQGFTGPLIEAQNKVAFKSLTYLLFMIIGTTIGYYAALDYKGIGMIIGTSIGWLVAQNVMNIFYHKVLNLNIFKFFKELFRKTLVSFIIVMILGYILNFIPGNSWFNFIIKCSLYILIFSVVIYKIGINNYEKKLFQNIFNKAFKRK